MLQPNLQLICKLCGFRPEKDVSMGEVRLHFQKEHDIEDPGKKDEMPMALTAFCPRCDDMLKERMTGVKKNGRKVTTYDCERCNRNYRVEWGR